MAEEEWVKELVTRIKDFEEWCEDNPNDTFSNIRLIHLVPTLTRAVMNLDIRINELESKK